MGRRAYEEGGWAAVVVGGNSYCIVGGNLLMPCPSRDRIIKEKFHLQTKRRSKRGNLRTSKFRIQCGQWGERGGERLGLDGMEWCTEPKEDEDERRREWQLVYKELLWKFIVMDSKNPFGESIPEIGTKVHSYSFTRHLSSSTWIQWHDGTKNGSVCKWIEIDRVRARFVE